jgi:hypothetical protein
VTLVGWAGWADDGDGNVTFVDCAGNWGTVSYKAGHATDQPTYFRVCRLGKTYANCVEPAGFYDPCGNGSSLSNNNTYTSRDLSGFRCNIADDYMGVLDTDACAPFRELPLIRLGSRAARRHMPR